MKIKHAIRSIITCAPTNDLIELDLSGAESWIVAHLADDENMIRELTSGDLHWYSAHGIYDVDYNSPKDKDQRYIGKKMNHSCGYRAKPPKVAEFINKEGKMTVSVRQVERWHEKWHRTFPNIRGVWWREIDEKLFRDRTLITPYGKKRKFYGFLTDDDTLKQATAFIPQSTVSYHLDGAIHPELGIAGGLLEIKRQITDANPEILLIQTAHDSVLIECPKTISTEIAQHCKELLTRPLIVNGHTFTIPVDCERYPRRWKEDGEKM